MRDDKGRILKDSPMDLPKRSGTASIPESSSLVLEISCNEVGQVVGRGGEIITRLERESRAWIEVDKGEGRVTVKGRPDAVAKARELILAEVTYCKAEDGT